MANNLFLSNVSFFLGIIGIIVATIPLWGQSNMFYSGIMPILVGTIGFIISLRIKKELNDDIVKAGLIINPISIILGLGQLILYFL